MTVSSPILILKHFYFHTSWHIIQHGHDLFIAVLSLPASPLSVTVCSCLFSDEIHLPVVTRFCMDAHTAHHPHNQEIIFVQLEHSPGCRWHSNLLRQIADFHIVRLKLQITSLLSFRLFQKALQMGCSPVPRYSGLISPRSLYTSPRVSFVPVMSKESGSIFKASVTSFGITSGSSCHRSSIPNGA